MFSNQPQRLSASLASRLSRGGRGTAFAVPSSVKGRLQGRLGLPAKRKESVHNRLGLSKPSPRVLKVWSNSFLKSLEGIKETGKGLSKRPAFNSKRKFNRSRSPDSVPVRIMNGAIVKGLRSDQLLLKKINRKQTYANNDRASTLSRPRRMEKFTQNSVKLQSQVSMDFNSGLKVSFENDAVKIGRMRSDFISSPQTDEMSTSSEEDHLPKSRPKIAANQRLLLELAKERPPLPITHRQVLDTQVQREIAALQGFQSIQHKGPGPGIKNFKMIPVITKHSLSERFTLEKTGL